jgi:integrase
MNQKLKLTPVEGKDGLFTGIKSDGKSYTVRKDRYRIFTPKEWKCFFNTLGEKKSPIFDCLINTGGRINEVIHLEKRDIDFEKGILTFKIVKKRNPFANGRIRSIKISSQYLERLRLYCSNLQQEDTLFSLSTQGVAQLFKRKMKLSKIKNYQDFSLHNIRKTTECWLNFLGNNHSLLLMHFGHNQSTAVTHYLTTDIYDSAYKFEARQILGDLYM